MVFSPASVNVPTHSLAQTSSSGSGSFDIARIGGLTDAQKAHFFVPHRKGFYMLAFAKGGQARHWLDMVPYTIQPDTLYFSSPQQVFLKEEGSIQATAICFTQEFLDLEEGELFRQLPIIQNPHMSHELALSAEDIVFADDICDKLLTEFGRGDGWRNSMLLAYLRVLLIYLSRLYTAQFSATKDVPDRALFHQFQTLVGTHFTELHEVAHYAGLLNVSARHLGELIKKQSGKTPIGHIHDRLLIEAKRLLFHTDSSMKEIAFGLGFEEASYFNRFFKRLTDSTPLAYRNSIRKMYH